MPTYEYRCPAGHDFEKFYRKISDAPSEVTCPQCGTVAERRLSAGAGLLFKGSGFYITDYGKDGKGARKEPAAGDSKGTESKTGDAKGGDAKPASGGSESGASKPAETAKPSESKKSTGGSGGGTGSSSGGAA